MTTLTNSVTIAAPRQPVWETLSRIDALEQYDPGTRSAVIVGDRSSGEGAQRKCELRPRGWFVERVVTWRPEDALAFELVSCSFPVTQLRHDYTLTESDGGTVVTQVMRYTLKFGAVGRLLDALVLRRQWERGIKNFLNGLQQHVETHVPQDGAGLT